jgi:hypothetical protein
MPRGGKRSGSPGTAYSNRKDLSRPAVLPASAPTGQPYGAAGAQLAAQQAVPMASGPSLPQGAPPQQAEEPYVMPQMTPLDAPSARLNEPVTAGLPVGPGPGPEALAGPSANESVEAQLRATYARFPTEQLRALIEMIDSGDV